MHRLTVALLAAFDAALAVAVGLAATLATFTLVWVFTPVADWSALWPASAVVWQLGHLVPFDVSLPGEYLAATGISADTASFTLSLPPLAFAAFTAIFAARSGARASRAEAWATGAGTGIAVFATLAALVALTAQLAVASFAVWQAILFPTLVFAVPILLGAVVTEWREAGAGVVARLRDRAESWPHGWGDVPSLAVRGAAVATTGLIGLGALAVLVALVFGGDEVVALFEAAHVDALGAVVITLGQLAYLPTFVVWGMAFVAGPGFALGEGTAVSPAGTQLGVVPGIPILGAVPESTSTWMLLLALLVVGAGALAGWIVRSRLAARGADHERIAERVVLTVAIAALTGAAAALLSALASGSIGPGRLAHVGPDPGPVALAVGIEVAVGAGILLLSPRRAEASEPTAVPEPSAVPEPVEGSPAASEDDPSTSSGTERSPEPGGSSATEAITEPITLPLAPDSGTETAPVD